MTVEQSKERAASRAVEEVADGMAVGLGSGSTAAHAIRQLGGWIADGMDVVGVPTSHQAAEVARSSDVPVRCLADVDGIDLAIDGADQVADRNLIKGGGGAHAREKVIADAADRLLIVVDETKRADHLDVPAPVSVFPDAAVHVRRRVEALGGTPELRRSPESVGPTVTEHGNFILDCDFGVIDAPGELADTLSGIPGVVAHGLFIGLADTIYEGSIDGVVER